MKILSYQSFSLYVNSGGSRILRRLYKGHEADVFSLAIEAGHYKHAMGAIAEKENHLEQAINYFTKGAGTEDSLVYQEPRDWLVTRSGTPRMIFSTSVPEQFDRSTKRICLLL